MEKKYDIAVAYRIYPKVSKIPPIFSDDKLELSELCLSSFKESLGGLKAKLWVLLDGCPSIYTELFKKYFDKEDLEIINLNGIGNAETFKLQMEILSKQNDSEYIYFAEDDYFYLSCEFKSMLELMKNFSDVHFATPYNHSDYISINLHKQFNSEHRSYKEKNWRTEASTTMTFLTNKENLIKTYNVFMTYCKKNDDASLWMSLTKHFVNNPTIGFNELKWFKIFVKAWLHCNKQILSGNKWKLWVPDESIATHMDNQCLSPEIDWKKNFNHAIEKINFVS